MKFRALKIYVIAFLCLLVLKWNVLTKPFFWDALNYAIPTAVWILENGFSLVYLDSLGMGHPPLFYLILALGFKLFGLNVVVAHVINLLFGALAIMFTYLLAEHFFNKKVAIVSSVLLLFTPLFFSQVGILLPEIALAGFATGTIYFAVKEKVFLYSVFGSLLILTKEPGLFLVLFLLIALFLCFRRSIKDCLKYCFPFVTFGLWAISNKILYGWYVFPRYQADALGNNIFAVLLKFFLICKTIFFDNYHWVLIALIVVFGASFLKFSKKKITLGIVLGLFVFVVTRFLIPYLFSPMQSLYSNIGDYLDIVSNFSYVFGILAFFIIFSYKRILKMGSRKIVFLGVIIFLTLGIFSFFPFSSKYILFIYPLFFISISYGLCKLFREKVYFIALLVVVLFVAQYGGESTDVGFTLDTNMEYSDMIEVHEQMAGYIEENYADATILACFPQMNELTLPYGGYVDSVLNVVGHKPLIAVSNRSFNVNVRIEGTDEYEEYNTPIDYSEVDLIYYSAQQYVCDDFTYAQENFNLTVVQSFEKNGKGTILYAIQNE